MATRNRPISTNEAPQAIGPYSQGMGSGDFIFVSGQLGLNPETGEFVGNDFASQAEQALQNIRSILVAGGADLNDVVSVDVFVTDLSLFGEFNKIYSDFFKSHKPARAVVEVAALPKDGLVEIKAMAIKKFGNA